MGISPGKNPEILAHKMRATKLALSLQDNGKTTKKMESLWLQEVHKDLNEVSIAEGEIQEILIFGRKIAGFRVAPEKQPKLRNISAENGEKTCQKLWWGSAEGGASLRVNVAHYGQIE